MNQPAFSPEAGLRWQMQQWLQHDANRLATAFWWSRYELSDCLTELRGIAAMKAAAAKYRGADMALALDVAAIALDDAIAAQERQHGASMDVMAAAAKEAAAAGKTLAEVRQAVAAAAEARALPPPLYLLSAALSEGVSDHRREVAWWKKREVQE